MFVHAGISQRSIVISSNSLSVNDFPPGLRHALGLGIQFLLRPVIVLTKLRQVKKTLMMIIDDNDMPVPIVRGVYNTRGTLADPAPADPSLLPRGLIMRTPIVDNWDVAAWNKGPCSDKCTFCNLGVEVEINASLRQGP